MMTISGKMKKVSSSEQNRTEGIRKGSGNRTSVETSWCPERGRLASLVAISAACRLYQERMILGLSEYRPSPEGIERERF